ncbi:redoxin domain-containing protein [Lacibacter luteus]|uniref:Redoxin domain-containing protein n=1 Tax=Lacibacter luteus TaxID=2508719 RepID=A0A4Q1CFH1_9BACT|nr:TlpA disulfide reductase family protein [Lacibacter luteus]RXK58433.1 redoxin domain-containing protein [Lacibacter luteus]
MKKLGFLIVVAALFCTQSSVFAQTGRPAADTLRRYYTRLANSKDQADKDLLASKMYELLKSKNESDWSTARQYFYQLQKTNVSDSIGKAIKIKFPLGAAVRNEEASKIYEAKTTATKEAAYKAWVKKFPPAKFGNDRIMYDYARNNLATAFAEEDNVKKAMLYVNMMESKFWKGEGSMGSIRSFIKNGHYKEAKLLMQEAIDNAYKYKTIWKDSTGAGFAAMGYPSYLSMYANILLESKDYQQALDYQQKAYDVADSTRRIGMNGVFAKIYMALGRDQEAFDKYDELVRHGLATPEVNENLKVLYKKLKGETGFDAYMAEVRKILAANVRKDLAKQIINKPAPAFSLVNFEGKTVSLADLKGKIVIVDFWATWCGPCKASFPAMQTAVSKYKDNPDVAFLFIHTWEREEAAVATENAIKYIKENNYTFNVMMDLKDQASGTNKVVSSFGVSGIPTKFIIDKNGNIRFKFIGFSGGNELAVEEIDAMIEMALKG